MAGEDNRIVKVGFAYSRLSQKERHKLSKEEIETSLVNAKQDILDYCKDNSVKLIKFAEERYKSGAKWDREKIAELIEKIKSYSIEHQNDSDLEIQFIFKNLSRLARDSVFQESKLRELEDPPYYIKIVSIEEGTIIQNKPVRTIIGAMNEMKIQAGKTESKIRHDKSLSKGIAPIRSPFGYWNDKNTKQWLIKADDSEIVRTLFSMLLAGKDYKSIIKKLNISVGLYYRIIENFENYCGKIIYREKVKDSKGRVVEVEKKIYNGKHEPILKDKNFNRKIKEKLLGKKPSKF